MSVVVIFRGAKGDNDANGDNDLQTDMCCRSFPCEINPNVSSGSTSGANSMPVRSPGRKAAGRSIVRGRKRSIVCRDALDLLRIKMRGDVIHKMGVLGSASVPVLKEFKLQDQVTRGLAGQM